MKMVFEKTKKLRIEMLAELEHKQWQHLIRFFQSLPPDVLRKKIYVDYKKLVYLDYKNLSEEDKEKDRVWARKVIKLLFRSD